MDRPFDAALWLRAEALAAKYRIILEPDDTVGFIGCSLEMPGVMADGKTVPECYAQVREALAVAVATLLERGETPPPPARDEQRTEQVNIRLTAEERFRLEETARRKGFRGLSDFVRASALAASC